MTTSPNRPSTAHRPDPRLRSEARAKAIMQQALTHLRDQPDAMRSNARAYLDMVSRKSLAAPAYIDAWKRLIELTPDEIARVVLDDTEDAITLRAMNPFFLPPDERVRIFHQYRRWPDVER